MLNAIIEGEKRDTGRLNCTFRAILKLFLYFLNLSIVNKLRLVSFELTPGENLDIDMSCLMDTSLRCHERHFMNSSGRRV